MRRSYRITAVTVVVVASAMGEWSPASAQSACSRHIARSSYGMGIDKEGDVWISGHTDGTLYQYAPNGDLAGTADIDAYANRGVAITPADNHVWVAHTGWDNTDKRISRYANDGSWCETVDLTLGGEYGYGPSAIAVDGNGDLWVTTMEAEHPAVWRVRASEADPGGGCPAAASTVIEYVDIDHLPSGEIHPLIEQLGTSYYAKPYNYGNMTGMVTLRTSASGTWTAIHDGEIFGARWTRVLWNTQAGIGDCPAEPVPAGTGIVVGVRAADRELDLTAQPFIEVENDTLFEGVYGRFVQVRTRLRSTAEAEPVFATPVLCDLEVLGDVSGPDCNRNGVPDGEDITSGPSEDCNSNGIPDECEIDAARSRPGGPEFFCTAFCAPDCQEPGTDGFGIPDECDIADLTSEDCSGNGIPDECEPDCNDNQIADSCDIFYGTSIDCNGNEIPDNEAGCEEVRLGACCMLDQTCLPDMCRMGCEALGGFYGRDYDCALDCEDGACCDDGECSLVAEEAACTGIFLGYGSRCVPDCCPQDPTGADSCLDVVPVTLSLPHKCIDLFGEPMGVSCDPANGDADCTAIDPTWTCVLDPDETNTVSVSGDASSATISHGPGLPSEPVWWEAVDIRGPGRLTVDFCCTFPPVARYSTVLYNECIGRPIPREASLQGEEWCSDGNPKVQWSLTPGVYYYPIRAGSDGAAGSYQMHFTMTAAPTAACCIRGTETCVETNRMECAQELDGFWLGEGAVSNPVVDCAINPCVQGVCCTGPGQCEEGADADSLADCVNNFDGVFIGGGPALSCADDPCPGTVCGTAKAESCKPGGGGTFLLSDAAACIRAADDFSFTYSGDPQTVNGFCWRGLYHEFGSTAPSAGAIYDTFEPRELVDCSSTYGDDTFTITLYEDDNGLPGEVAWSTEEPIVIEAGDRVPVEGDPLTDPPPLYEYSSATGPGLFTLENGGCYWIEIQNHGASQNGCYWLWETSTFPGNLMTIQDSDGVWEFPDEELSGDVSFCLLDDFPLSPSDCSLTPTGACCDESTGACWDSVEPYACEGWFQADGACVGDGNGNGIDDECDDCNANGVPDYVDLNQGTSEDCNLNDTPDECDLLAGTSGDYNGDGVPDECMALTDQCRLWWIGPAQDVPDGWEIDPAWRLKYAQGVAPGGAAGEEGGGSHAHAGVPHHHTAPPHTHALSCGSCQNAGLHNQNKMATEFLPSGNHFHTGTSAPASVPTDYATVGLDEVGDDMVRPPSVECFVIRPQPGHTPYIPVSALFVSDEAVTLPGTQITSGLAGRFIVGCPEGATSGGGTRGQSSHDHDAPPHVHSVPDHVHAGSAWDVLHGTTGIYGEAVPGYATADHDHPRSLLPGGALTTTEGIGESAFNSATNKPEHLRLLGLQKTGGAGTPVGVIIGFEGDASEIPPDWYECDGSTVHGVTLPDLRGLQVEITEYPESIGDPGLWEYSNDHSHSQVYPDYHYHEADGGHSHQVDLGFESPLVAATTPGTSGTVAMRFHSHAGFTVGPATLVWSTETMHVENSDGRAPYRTWRWIKYVLPTGPAR